MSHEAGKGDAMRPTNHEAFAANFDRIFGGADPYASEAETAALLVPDNRTPAERKLAAMIEANHGNEQGAELEIVLRQVALQLIDSDMPKVGCVNHDCDKCNSQPEACTWQLTDHEALIWESSCGEAWSFIDGGPEENRVRFCQGCGKPVTVVSTDEEPEDDICSGCSGSGEGMYDGSTCYKCKGRGVEPVEQDDEP